MGKNNKEIEEQEKCYHAETIVTCFKSNGKKNRHSMSCCTKEQYDEILKKRRERAKKKMEELKKKTSLELVSKIDDYEPVERYGKDQCSHTGKPRVPKKEKKKRKVKWERKRKYPKNEDMYEANTFGKQTEFDAKLKEVKRVSQEMYDEEMYDQEFFSCFSDSEEIFREYEISFDEIYESNMRKLAKLYAKEGEMLKSQKILKILNDYILNDYMNCLKSNAEWFFKKTISISNMESVVSSDKMHLLDTWNAYYRLTYSKIFYKKIDNRRWIDYSKPLISYDVELMVCRKVELILSVYRLNIVFE